MKIIFENNRIKKTILDYRKGIKTYGDSNFRKIQKQLVQVESADCFSDLKNIPALNFHLLKGNWKKHYAIDALHPFRIITKAIDQNGKWIDAEIVDQTTIDTISIVTIIDYH